MSEEKGFAVWLDSRMPTLKILWNDHMAKYYAPKNFNFWYYFGVLAMVVLGYSAGDWCLAFDELPRICRAGICLCGIYYA